MEGNSFTLFVSPHLPGGGVPRPGLASWWGTPPQVPPPLGPGWGYSTLGTPLSDLARGYPWWGVGYPTSGTPGQTWQGVPLPRGTTSWVPPNPHQTWPGGTPAGGGTPPWVPPRPGHLRYSPPPLDLAGGGTPPWVHPPLDLGRGYPLPGGGVPPLRETDGVLDTPRSVCLLRSRSRTFFLFV